MFNPVLRGNFNRLGSPSNTAALEVARVCVNKCVLSRFENIINSSLNCITTKSVGDLPLRSLGFLLPRHLVPSPSYCGMISQKLTKYLLYKKFPTYILVDPDSQYAILLNLNLALHSGRSYYIYLLLIKMAVVAMFQENWSQIKIPSTN